MNTRALIVVASACAAHLQSACTDVTSDTEEMTSGRSVGTGTSVSSPTSGPTGSVEGGEVVRAELQMVLPVLDPADILPASLNRWADHDLKEGTPCLDYAGYTHPWCFDQHKGTDFKLLGGFHAMNEGRGEVVAAADGVVVKVVDGNYDRCHAGEYGGVDCDGYEPISNRVTIVHPTGHQTEYWHLAMGIEVVEGASVVAGEVIGRMGASGNTVEPDVHFELQDEVGDWIDPFAGTFSQPETYWCDQGEHGEFPATSCD